MVADTADADTVEEDAVDTESSDGESYFLGKNFSSWNSKELGLTVVAMVSMN